MPDNGKNRQSGNIFFTLFGAIALVGVIGAATTTLIRGPLSTVSAVNTKAKVDSQLAIASRLATIAAAQLPNGGNCDYGTGDTYVEPLHPTTGAPSPAGGGQLPNSVGASQVDPWGTPLGYCVWDLGAAPAQVGDPLCDAGAGEVAYLAGGHDSTQPVFVVLSAGPDRIFQTSCEAWADNVGAAGPPSNAATLVNKPASSDDIIAALSYQEALNVADGLWSIMSGDPNTITTDKNVAFSSGSVEFASGTTAMFQGTAQFAANSRLDLGFGAGAAGLFLLPDNTELLDAECTIANNGVLRINVTSFAPNTALEMCDASMPGTFQTLGGAGLTVSKLDDLSDASAGGDYLFLGQGAGLSYNSASGSNNLGVGISAASNLTTGSDNIVIGNNAQTFAVGTTDSIVIGHGITGSGNGTLKIGEFVTGSGIYTSAGLLDISGTIEANMFRFDSNLYIDDSAGGMVLATGGGPRLTIDSSGNVSIASSAGTELTVTGDVDVSGDTESYRFISTGGTSGSPGFTFDGYTNSGVYYNSGSGLGFSVGGTSEMELDSAGLRVHGFGDFDDYGTFDGYVQGDSFQFNNSTSSGLFFTSGTGMALNYAGVSRVFVGTTGRVGISTTNPQVELDVNGAIRPAATSATCAGGSIYGAIRYASGDLLEMCSAIANDWVTIGTSGGGGGGTGSLWTNNTTYITRGSAHMLNTGVALPGSLEVAGTRMVWYPNKSAFRAGGVGGSQWDDTNIGNYSMALGTDVTASGVASFAVGQEATASGDNAFAFGLGNTAGAAPQVSAANSFGIFMGDQAGVNLNTANVMLLAGGSLVIDPDPTSATNIAPSRAGLNIDVEGDIGAIQYCDEDGNNCFTASSIASGSVGVPGFDREIIYNSNGTFWTTPGFVFSSTGYLGIGNVNPQASIDIGGTGALLLPRGDGTNRPGGINGMLRYNSANGKFEAYQAGAWQDILTGAATSSFIGLTDTPVAYASAGQMLRVNATENGLEFFVPVLNDLADVNTTPSDNDVLSYDSASGEWVNVPGRSIVAGADTQIQYNSGGFLFAEADFTWDGTNNVLTIANSGTGAMRVGNGAVGTPSLSFTADTNTGLYSVGADALGVAANGVNYMTIQAPGTANASVVLGGVDAIILPRGITAERPSTGVDGMLRYNSANGKFEGYQAGAWQDILTGSAAASAPDRGIQFNSGGNFAASANFQYTSAGALLVTGSYTGAGTEPVSGAGTRMFFDPGKAAFRAGHVTGNQWNFSSAGNYSTAFGYNTTASDLGDVAMGGSTTASGGYSTAMGTGSTASGMVSTAMGAGTTASGTASTAMGQATTASGLYSTAMGWGTIASGTVSTALGRSVVAGNGTAGSGLGDGSFALGLIDNIVPITTRSQVTGIQSFGIFMGDQDGLVFASSNTMGLFGGKFVIDPRVPAQQLFARSVLDLGAATDAILLPIGDGTNRPAAPVNGMLRYNSASGKFEGYQAGAWQDILTGAATSSFIGLTDTPVAYASAGQMLRVNATENGLEFFVPVLNDLADVNTTPSDNDVLSYDSASGEWVNVPGRSIVAGADTQIQYNSGGFLFAEADFTWDGTNNVLTIANSGTGAMRVGNGAVGTPSLSFTADTNTGLYSVGADALGVAANGVNYMTIQAPGTANASVVLGGVDAIILPRGITAQRPTAGVDGMLRYNSASGKFEGYQAGSWQDILTGAATSSFIGLTDTPVAYASAGQMLRVNATEDGLEFFVPVLNDLANVNTTPSDNDVLSYDSASGEWVSVSVSSLVAGAAAPDRGIQFNSGGSFTANSNFVYKEDGDLSLKGTHNATASGPGMGSYSSFYFDVQSSSIRAGQTVSGVEWSDANIGTHSTAFGRNVTAKGDYSFAQGNAATAEGENAIAIGDVVVAHANNSVVIGRRLETFGLDSLALGSMVQVGDNFAAGSGDGSAGLGLFDDATIIVTPPQVLGIQSFGIFMGDQDGLVFASSNTMGLFGGKFVIDPRVPAQQLFARSVLDLGAATDAILLPIGDGTNRPAAPVNGMIRYNSASGKFEGYQGGLWQDILTSGGGAITAAGANTQIQFNSGGTLGADADYTWDMTNNILAIANSGTGAMRVGNGTVGTPSVSFTADTNTGLYSIGADALGVAANGVNYVTIQAPGTANASVVFSGADAVILPRGDGASRPTAGVDGMLRYNSASGKFEGYQAGSWQDILTGAATSSFIGLTDTPVAYASAGQMLRVNATEDGLEFFALALNDLANVNTTPSDNDVLSYDSASGEWVSVSVSSLVAGAAAPDRGIQFNSGGSFAADAGLVFSSTGDLMVTGTYSGMASVPASGAGVRMFFDVQASAFRVGRVDGTQWDNANLATYSVAMGRNTTASGSNSMAFGLGSIASQNTSTALGRNTTASGDVSMATGDGTTASGTASTSMGFSTTASGNYSTAMGSNTIAAGDYSTVFGSEVNISATGDGSAAFGLTTTSPVTDPIVSGAQSFALFMGNHNAVNFASSNTMGLFGGQMVVDPRVPAQQLFARSVLDLGAATDAIVLPYGDTAQRPASPVDGMLRYNSASGKFEGYQGGAWQDILTGAVAGGASAPDRGIQFNSGGNFAADANLVYTSAGWFGIGTGSPQATLDIAGTDAIVLPRGDTAQRPGTAIDGMIRYNSATSKFEGYQAGSWLDIITSSVTPAGVAGNIQFNSGGTALGASANLTYTSAGFLGLGLGAPQVMLDVAGEARLGNTSLTCAAGIRGALRFNSGSTRLEMCDGVDWRALVADTITVDLVLTPATNNAMNVTGCGTPPCQGTAVTFTLQNQGATTSAVIATSLSNTTNFTITSDTCNGNTLAPSLSCQIDVTPQSSGNEAFTGLLNITANNNPFAIMQGTSSGFGCSPGVVGAGGVYAACGLNDGDGVYDLIVMPGGCDGTTLNPTCSGNDGAAVQKLWGTSGVDIPYVCYVNDFACKNAKNAVNIMAAQTIGAGSFAAASYCDAMTYGGHNDWYLPNQYELQSLIYPQKNSGNLTGFTNAYYWSSNQRGWTYTTQAIAVDMSSSADGYSTRNVTTHSVRCVRRENLPLPTATADTNPNNSTTGYRMRVTETSGQRMTSSEGITIIGILQAAPVSVSGASGNPKLTINGGAEVDSGTANWGDVIRVVMDAPTVAGTMNTATVNLGPDTYTYKVAYADTTKESRVFVTDGDWTGILGGLGGADAKCTNAANAAAIGGTWVAILSDANSNAVDRVPWNWGVLKRLDGVVVANDWADLWDGNIQNPINVNENMITAGKNVWTGTLSNGMVRSATCASWTSNSTSSVNDLAYGTSGGVGDSWIDTGVATSFCSVSRALYCVESVAGGIPPGSPAIGLDDLADVDLTTTPPGEGQLLKYVSSSGLWVVADTDAIVLPVGDTAQRPGTGIDGMLRYNSASGKFEGYQAGSWTDIVTGAATGSAANPAGAVQFNSGGSFGGSAGFVWDATNTRLGVGTATPANPLEVVGVAQVDALQVDGTSGLAAPTNGLVAGADTQIQFNSGGTFGASGNLTWNNGTAKLTVTGDIDYTGMLTDTSDRRLKADIHPLRERGSMLEKLEQVDTYSFRMKNDKLARVEFGVMAQELETLFPELVMTAQDEMGTKSVNYIGLIAPMITATQELRAENEALRAELDAVKTDIAGLKAHTGYGIDKAMIGVGMLLAFMLAAGATAGFVLITGRIRNRTHKAG